MLYKVLRRMIERGQTEGMAEKLDVFFAAGRVTKEQYEDLLNVLEV